MRLVEIATKIERETGCEKGFRGSAQKKTFGCIFYSIRINMRDPEQIWKIL